MRQRAERAFETPSETLVPGVVVKASHSGRVQGSPNLADLFSTRNPSQNLGRHETQKRRLASGMPRRMGALVGAKYGWFPVVDQGRLIWQGWSLALLHLHATPAYSISREPRASACEIQGLPRLSPPQR